MSRVIRKGTDRLYIVYGLYLKDKIFYIGKTSLKLEDRLRQHLKTNKKIISKYKKYEKSITIQQIEIANNSVDLHSKEIKWIKYFKNTGTIILNKIHTQNTYVPLKRNGIVNKI